MRILATDAGIFTAWLEAHGTGDVELETLLAKRFTPDYEVAFDAWLQTDPFINPSAPPGPASMPEYKNRDAAKAAALNGKASATFAEGTEARETGEKYVRNTVLFAVVLFLVALAQWSNAAGLADYPGLLLLFDRLARRIRGRDGRVRLRRSVALSAVVLVATLTACGDQDPSIQSRQSVSTTSSSSPSTTSSSTATGTISSAPGVVSYRGIELRIPASWPVHDLATDPARCVRFDEHAAFLGPAGAAPQCPARVVGRTEAVHVQPRSGATRAVEASATSPATINGLSVLIDPDADTVGAHTVVVVDLDLVVTVTIGADPVVSDQIVQSLHAS